jgi:hypothetical protein
MGFDDLFENSGRYGKHNYNYPRDIHYPHHRSEERYSRRMPGREHYAIFIIDRIWNNRRLRLVLIVAIIILLAVIIAALFLILPLIVRIIDSVTQTGLKSVVEDITGLITKLWNGSGN